MSGTLNPQTTFLTLRQMVRAECGRSQNPAMGVNDDAVIASLVNRIQVELYYSFSWPGMRVDRDVKVANGQRYYHYPTDLQFEDISKIWCLVNTVYTELAYGVGPDQWVLYNPDLGLRSWPTRRWQHNTDLAQFELWPIPDANAQAQNAYVRLRGTRTCFAMQNDSDPVTLDPYMLSLYAAAELLERDGGKDAKMKQGRADNIRKRIIARQGAHKRDPFIIGGGPRGARLRGRLGLEFVPPGYGSGPQLG